MSGAPVVPSPRVMPVTTALQWRDTPGAVQGALWAFVAIADNGLVGVNNDSTKKTLGRHYVGRTYRN